MDLSEGKPFDFPSRTEKEKRILDPNGNIRQQTTFVHYICLCGRIQLAQKKLQWLQGSIYFVSTLCDVLTLPLH